MTGKLNHAKDVNEVVPKDMWVWNMYGAGIENIGRNGKPELFAVPDPGADQILVRVDSVGMCFSDVKLIQQGGQHPKLYNRDLINNPTRLGHEAAVTVIKVGGNLQAEYMPGQRFAIQPDIYQDEISTAYGYTIPGGLTQFHLIGSEILDGDDGSYVISIEDELGYAETALTEPWACVEAAYTQRRRLIPKKGGIMWIIGDPGDDQSYSFSRGLDAPEKIILTDVPKSLRELIMSERGGNATIMEHNHLSPADYLQFSERNNAKGGFDDIIVLNPHSAELITEAAKLIAFRGVFNVIGSHPLDSQPEIDVGRIHYHYTAYIGNSGSDIGTSYGEERNRSDLRKNGIAVFVGAGGPMGQMHIQRAIEKKDGPVLLIATEINDFRLNVLQTRFGSLAKTRGKRLLTFNPAESDQTMLEFMNQETENRGADDVVVCVPVAPLIAEAANITAADGMLNLFAGVPIGTMVSFDFSPVYLNGMQLTGTSGSRIVDQETVVLKALAQELSPNRSVAAVGGMDAALEGIEAMMTSRFAGKIVIFPQLKELPLVALDDFSEKYPDLAEKLGQGNLWNKEVEAALIERFSTNSP